MRRASLLVLLALVALLSGCHGKQEAYKVTDDEGLYVAAGGLKYQIQLSRSLNPALPKDAESLRGVAPADAHLRRGQIWFGIWMRVENPGHRAIRPTPAMAITDTQGHVYRPVSIDPRVNAIAYTTVPIAPAAVVPDQNTLAGQSPPQGALVLFKLDTSVYQNRPLDLHLLSSEPPERTQASISLDL